MGSRWFNRNAAGSSNNFAGRYGNEKPEVNLDLSLKLGLPEEQKNNTNSNVINPVPANPVANNYLSNMNFNSSYQAAASTYKPVGGHGSHEYHQYGMASHPAISGFGNNFPMNNEGRIGYGLNQLYDIRNYQYSQNMINPMGSGFENYSNMINNGAGGSMMGSSCNPSGYSSNTIAFPPPPITNEYTLIDTPARRSRNIEIHDPFLVGSSTAAAEWRGVCRQRSGTYSEPNKRCSNFNCGTTETPMWRRGPLGPKTLCNACGIKYRKEEEKRRTKEASKSSAKEKDDLN